MLADIVHIWQQPLPRQPVYFFDLSIFIGVHAMLSRHFDIDILHGIIAP